MPRIGTICFWFIFMNRLVNFCITLQLIVAISFQRVLQAAIALVHSLAFALRLLCSGICCGVNLLLAISRRNRRGCTTLGPPLGTHTSSRAAAPFVIVPLLFWSASDSGWALFFYFYYVFFFPFLRRGLWAISYRSGFGLLFVYLHWTKNYFGLIVNSIIWYSLSFWVFLAK